MNLWQIIDFLVIGSVPVSIEGIFDVDETKRRLSMLDNSAESSSIPLTVALDGDHVQACYEVKLDSPVAASPYHSGVLHLVRPIFRGRISAGPPVRLQGSFGAGWIVRLLGLAAIALVLCMVLGWTAPFLGKVGEWFWAVPLIFVGACVVSRINGADDIRLIHNNLAYAMRGDESPS